MKTSSSDGTIGWIEAAAWPDSASSAAICRVPSASSATIAWTRLPNSVASWTKGARSSRSSVPTGSDETISSTARPAKTCFSSPTVPSATSRPACISAIRPQCSASSR